MRFITVLVLFFLLCFSLTAEPGNDYSKKIEESRKTGIWVVETNIHLFQLANFFFPERPVASVKFIQDVVKLNSGYFTDDGIRSLIPGVVLRLPGYVMVAHEPADPDKTEPDTYPLLEKKLPAENMSVETEVISEKVSPELTEYSDQYMDISELEAIDAVLKKQPPGRRALQADYRYYENQGHQQTSIEHGLDINYKQETMRWGNLFAETTFLQSDTNSLNTANAGDDWIFKAGQRDMPVGNSWLLDNTIGQQRSLPNSFLLGGYRYRLPGSPLSGISGRLRSQNTQFTWTAGNTGDYDGVAIRGFTEDGGKTIALSARHDLSDNLSIGGALSSLKDHKLIDNHSSLLGAVSFNTTAKHHDLHWLLDDNGNMALWNDNSFDNIYGWLLRMGGFYAQPDLKWNDSSIASDQQGVYLQGSHRLHQYELNLGYDYQKFGIDKQSPGTSDNHSLFANGLYKFNYRLNTGTNFSFTNRRFISDGDDNTQRGLSISQFLRYRGLTGITSLELFYSQEDSTDNSSDSNNRGLTLRKDWRLPFHQDIQLEIRAEQESFKFRPDITRLETSLNYTNDSFDTVSWGLNFTAFDNHQDTRENSTGLHVDLSGRWQMTPKWYSSIRFSLGESKRDLAEPFTDNLIDRAEKDETLWITLGYQYSRGLPFQYYGRESTTRAAGSISGVVFFDENRDGIRQASEKLARDVRVLLDGKYELLTDRDGEYTFKPVYSGNHTVGIVIEDLPLPWSLDNESSIPIKVDNRRNSELDFALTKI